MPDLIKLEKKKRDWTLDGPVGYADPSRGAMVYDREGNGYLVADISYRYAPDDAPEDARLIAAAPSLLEIATELHHLVSGGAMLVEHAESLWTSRGLAPPQAETGRGGE